MPSENQLLASFAAFYLLKYTGQNGSKHKTNNQQIVGKEERGQLFHGFSENGHNASLSLSSSFGFESESATINNVFFQLFRERKRGETLANSF